MPDQVLSAFPDEKVDSQAPAKAATPTAAPPSLGLSAFPAERDDRLTDAVGRAPGVGADAAAQIFDLQLKTGLPADVIRRNLDEVQKQATASTFDAAAFRQQSPLVTKWLEENPLNASVAQDDLLPLSKLEHGIRLATNSVRALGGGLIGGLNMGAWGVLEVAGDVLGVPSVSTWAKAAGADAAAMAAGIKGEQRGAGPNERAFYSGFESIGSSAPILAASIATENPTLALSLMGTQTGGQAYTQARAAGVSIPGALVFGTAQGAVEAATEMLPVHGLFGDLAKGAGLFKTLAHQAILEVPGEQLATALQDLNEWAILRPGESFQTYLQERPSAAVQTLIATLVATGAQTGAVHTLNKAIGGLTAERVVKDLGDAVKGSQLAARSPAKFAEFLASATVDTPLERVYAPIETWTSFWQEQGVDPAEMAEEAGSTRAAYREALDAGHDLALPTAGYATAIAGTEHNTFWQKEIRLQPDEMNAREAAEFVTAHSDAVTSAALMAPEPSPVQAIHDQVVKHLGDRGLLRPEDAETNAAVVSSMLTNFIEKRAGLNARALFEARTDPRFVERVAGPEDIATGTPEGQPAGQAHAQESAALEVDLTDVLNDPAALAALERRQPGDGEAPATGDRRVGNAALKAELEAETAGQAVGAGGGQQTLAELARDPSLRTRAAAMATKAKATPRIRAEFLAHGPDGPIFNIVGGPKHGSTVGTQGVTDLGLALPTIPADTGEKLNGDQIRARMIAARAVPAPEVEGPLFQPLAEGQQIDPAQAFFSRIIRAVQESSLAKASGSQWAATIKNYKGGISKGEAELLDVEGLAPEVRAVSSKQDAILPGFELDKVYTKQQALDFLAQNELKIEIVDLNDQEREADDDGENPDDEITESEIEDEISTMRDERIDSEEDYYRQEHNDEEEKEQLREDFRNRHYPGYEITEQTVDEGTDDERTFWVAEFEGELITEWQTNAEGHTRQVTQEFVDEDEAQEAVDELISEKEDEYVEEHYSEPDFREQAIESVDNDWSDDDMRDEALDRIRDRNAYRIRHGHRPKPKLNPLRTRYGSYVERGPRTDYHELFVTAPNMPELPGPVIVAKSVQLATGQNVNPNPEITLGPQWHADGASGWTILLDGQMWIQDDGETPHVVWNPSDPAQALADATLRVTDAIAAAGTRTAGKPRETKWNDGHDLYSFVKNPIARLRVNTRVTSLGKTLFVEEIQPPGKSEQKDMPPLLLKNWRELGWKYALRFAAEHGHDAVAWTTGEEQAKRYSLESVVDKITWATRPDDGVRSLEIEPSNGHNTIRLTYNPETGEVRHSSDERFSDKNVVEIVGEDVLELMKEPAGVLEPEDLKVGGFGLKRLYDKDFVSVVNGLPAVKKTKGRVEEALVSTRDDIDMGPNTQPAQGIRLLPAGLSGEGAETWVLVRADGSPWNAYTSEADANAALEQWNKNVAKYQQEQAGLPHAAIRMTPELTAAVLGGQPLFQSLDAIAGLPQVEGVLPDRTVREVPFPYVSDQEANEIAGTRALHAPAERRTVKLADVIATQRTVTEDVVREYVDQPGEEVATGVELGGQVYLTGGHHRAVAAWARGEASIEVDVQQGDPAKLLDPVEPTGTFQDRQGAQLNQEKRGAISFNPTTGKALISLFAKADLSTFQHEVAHLFLELVGDTVDTLRAMDPAGLTDSQRGVIADYDNTLLPFLGVSNRGLIGREQHERFATAWEEYLMTGEAPSAELRPVFSRIKAWLVGVYRNLRRQMTLTPEVRGFMDRLLATDQAIDDAERDARIVPLFTDAAAANMTPAEFELYRKDMEAAAVAARDRLDAQVRADVAREQTRLWKDQKAAIRAQVEAELASEPLTRALVAMREGDEPLSLNRAAVVQIIGEAATKALPRPAVYTRDGGVHPDAIAEMFGFANGEALLEAVGTTLPLKTRIDQETERRMLIEHGGLLVDGSLHEKAQAAVANEHRDKVIRAEIRALQKLQRTVKPHVKLAEKTKKAEIAQLAGQVETLQQTARKGPAVIARGVPNAKTIRDAATRRIADTPIRSIVPSLYWSAARQSNELAVAAAAGQDFTAAIHHQTQQLLNLALYRESARVLEDVDRRVTAALALDKPAARRRIGRAGATYQDQIDGILDRYEFAQQSQKTLDRRANLRKWAAAMEGEGFEVGLTAEQLDDARQVNYRQLTYAELVGVTDGLKQIEHLAGLKFRLLEKNARRQFVETRDVLVDSLREHNKTTPLPLGFRPSDARRRGLALAFAAHRKVAMLARALDGHLDGGAMWDAIIRPLNQAADQKADRSKKEGRAFADILEQHYPGRELGRLSRLSQVPTVGALSHEERIAVALNWGTPQGRDRLLNDPTRRWSEPQVQAILETLDSRDWQFVRATWAYNERFWPEIRDQEERVTGIAPDKVETLEVQTKRFGTFPGGYYHIAYDGRLSARAQQNEAATIAQLAGAAAYVRTTTRQGHVEARQAHVKQSLKLELSVQFAHIEEVIHSLTHRETLIDVTRILRDSKVQRALYETAGDQVYQQFTQILEDIASGNKPANGPLEKAANFSRSGVQIAGLGWNLWTAAQQPLGLFNGMSRVGPSWVMRGLVRWLRDAASFEATTTWIAEVSPMMRNRLDTATQDLADLRGQLARPGGWFDDLVRTVSADHLTQQTILDGYMWHIGLMQRVADVPTWLGAYEKAMAAEADEPRAVALADQAVLDSQGGGQMKDLAQVQRGGPIAKLYMTFYSYGSTVLNSTIDVAGATNYKSPASVATLLGHLGLLYIAPAFGTVALAHAFGKSGGDDEDWTDWLLDVGREGLSSALNGIVLVRELTGLLREGTRGYEGPAGARFINLVYALGNQVKQGVVDEGLFKAANAAAGIVFRYPASQVQRTVDGFVALEEGRSRNPMVLFTGPPPKRTQ